MPRSGAVDVKGANLIICMRHTYIVATGDNMVKERAQAKSDVSGWDEQEVPGPADTAKLTRVTYEQRLTGDFDGTASSSILIAYRPDGSARYSGYDRLVGRFGDRSGSLVVEVSGTYDSTGLNATTTVVAGTGRGGFTGVQGAGSVTAPAGGTMTVTLYLELP